MFTRLQDWCLLSPLCLRMRGDCLWRGLGGRCFWCRLGGCDRGGGGWCFWSGGDLSVRAFRTHLHDRDLGPRLHRLAFFGEDLAQDAGHRRGHLGIDLVGINLEHRLELDDLVAWFDEPLRDRPFVNRLPQLRHDDAGGLSSHQYAARSLNTFVILSGVGMKNSSIGMA